MIVQFHRLTIYSTTFNIWQQTVGSLWAGLIIKGNGVISEKPHFVMEIGRIYIMAAQNLYTLYSARSVTEAGEKLCAVQVSCK